MTRQNRLGQLKKQGGVALILAVVILVMVATTIALNFFDIAALNSKQDQDASKILAEAKLALIGYSLNRVGSGERPGNMPRPDYFAASESPANYDGTADGGCLDSTKSNGLPMITTGANMRCLGRLPWQTIGLNLNNPTEVDVIGKVPWYAVSANLVDPGCLDEINPDLLNMTYTGYICHSATKLPYPWLTVRDSRGNVLSNRVAVVLILPGRVINGQSRATSPLANVGNYLDSVVVPVGCNTPCVPGTYSNADFDNDFIMASGLTGVNVDQNDQNAAITINDRLLYITIDELMAELTKRAAVEAKRVLRGYKALHGNFPFAASLGSSGNNFVYSGTSKSGMVPIDGTDTCWCGSGDSCACNFNLVSSVKHTRSSGSSYTSASGACSGVGSTTCTCTGQGQCQSASGRPQFICDITTSCSYLSNVATTNPQITYMPLSPYSNIASANGGCSLSGPNVVCNGSGSFNVGLAVADWFKDNSWQEFFYYRWSSFSSISAGTYSGVESVLIGAGNPIQSTPYAASKVSSAQSRPSGNLNDYLDSNENTNGDLIFDAPNTKKAPNYNDQTFIVNP
jgi:hypothetical protein